MKEKALVILSGGQDSTTCLFLAKKHYKQVHAITFDYGQRHNVELVAALHIQDIAQVSSYEVINVKKTLTGTSPLVNRNEDVERYKDVESLPGGLEKTFVPARNALFLVIAANRAYCLGIKDIIIGVSQEDFGGYPDCRTEFITAMNGALASGLDPELRIIAPLIFLTKKETVLMAKELGEDCWRALKYSHTCYNGELPPCGKCHSCLLRAKGFNEANLKDPIYDLD